MAVRTVTDCPTRIKAIIDVYSEAAEAKKRAEEQMDELSTTIRDYFKTIKSDYGNPKSLKLEGMNRVIMCTDKDNWKFNQNDIEAIRVIIPDFVEEKTTYKLVGVNRNVIMRNPELENFLTPFATSLSVKK